MFDNCNCNHFNLVIPRSFEECFTYEMQVLWLKREIDNLSTGGESQELDVIKANLEALTKQVNQLSEDVSGLDLDQLKTDVSTLTQRVQALENSDVPGRVTNLETATSALQTSYQDLNTRVASQEVKTGQVETKADNAQKTATDAQESAAMASQAVAAMRTELDGKQNKLTFDNTPTAGSSNPVTSSGIKAAIDAIPGGEGGPIDDTVSESSANAVKSSGIYTFVKTLLEGYQKLLTIDPAPTQGSDNPASSGGIWTALEGKQDVLTIADTVTDDGTNPVKSSGIATFTKEQVKVVADALATAITDLTNSINTKQNTLTFDSAPTADSVNPVTSDGIKKAIDAVPTGDITVDNTVTESSVNPVTSAGIFAYVAGAIDALGLGDAAKKAVLSAILPGDSTWEASKTNLPTGEAVVNYIAMQLEAISTALAGKQNTLQFDLTPTTGSENPVTSGGIANWPTSSVAANVAKPVTAQGVLAYINGITQQGEVSNPDTYDIYSAAAVNNLLAGKMPNRVVTTAVSEGSADLITSGGVWSALQNIDSIKIIDCVTNNNARIRKATKSGDLAFVECGPVKFSAIPAGPILNDLGSKMFITSAAVIELPAGSYDDSTKGFMMSSSEELFTGITGISVFYPHIKFTPEYLLSFTGGSSATTAFNYGDFTVGSTTLNKVFYVDYFPKTLNETSWYIVGRVTFINL